jgi:hypothetical protein
MMKYVVRHVPVGYLQFTTVSETVSTETVVIFRRSEDLGVMLHHTTAYGIDPQRHKCLMLENVYMFCVFTCPPAPEL